MPTELAALRERIDGLDEKLVALLVERFACMRQAARIKPDRNAVYDGQRIAAVISHVRQQAEAGGADAAVVAAITDIYRNIIARSIAYEFACYDRERESGRPE
ncbi:MAG: chorismate mutase [Alphaproteobacteria bacterium]|nr:MAG: chorismate mutase [Alphaproteobacteria bacterium]